MKTPEGLKGSGSRWKIAESFLLFWRKVPPCWLDDNEPRKVRKRTGIPVNFVQSLRAELRRVVMTSGVSSRAQLFYLPIHLIRGSRVSLSRPTRWARFRFVPTVARRETRFAPRKNTQLSLHPIVDETAEIYSIPWTVESLRNFIWVVRFPVYGVTEKSVSRKKCPWRSCSPSLYDMLRNTGFKGIARKRIRSSKRHDSQIFTR